MARREAAQPRSGEIQAPPAAARSGAGQAALEGFEQRLGRLSNELFELHAEKVERQASDKGVRESAAGAFKLREGGTRADNAYNRAGLPAHFERLKLATADQVERIYNENQHDPKALETALEGYRKGTEAEILKSTPDLAPDFMAFWDRTTRPYLRTAAADHDRLQAEQNIGALADSLAVMGRQHEQRAYLSDGFDTREIAASREEYLKRLVDAGPQGAFVVGGIKFEADPGRAGAVGADFIAKELAAYDRTIIGARYKGEYARAAKGGRGAKFIEGFQKNDRLLGEISLAERDELARWMRGQESAAEAVRSAANQAFEGAVDAAIAAVRRNETPGDLDGLLARSAGTPKGEELRIAVGNQDRVAQYRQMPPQQQAAMLKLERESMKGLTPATAGGDEGYARETRAATDRIQSFEQAQRETIEALQKDPFGYAVAVGNVAAPPEFVDRETGILNPTALAARKADADRMTALYGFPMPGMTAAEIEGFGNLQLSVDPVTRTANMDLLLDNFGPDHGLAVMRQMNDKGYLIDAAAGGLALDGAPDVAQMVYQGDAALGPIEGKPSPYKFPDIDFDPAFASAMGTVYALNPAGELTTKEAVKRVLVAKRVRNNQRPDAPLADAEVEDALRLVMGGDLIRVGGRGGTLVTPPKRGATEDDFTRWWESIDAGQVKAAGGMPGWSNEDAAELIRERGLPVELEQGVYSIVVPGAGELDLTRGTRNNQGKLLILRYAEPR